MSVRSGLLALVAESPTHGYQLRLDFEARTRGTWPINIGQVYTTLARLERDGFVEVIAEEDGQRTYAVTAAGRNAVAGWFAQPVTREAPPRDEFAIKLAVAATTPGVDAPQVIQAQRTETLRGLRHWTARRAGTPDGDLAALLVLDGLVLTAEAEMRWLDACEARVARHAQAPAGTRADTRANAPAHSPANAPAPGTRATTVIEIRA